MIGLAMKFGGWLFSSALGRVLKSVDQRGLNAVETERIKSEIVMEAARQQTAQFNGPGRWLHALFIVPLGAWFTSVIVYSMLFCRGCAFPQDWTIAALPPPLDQWSGIIICSLFGYGAFVAGMSKITR